MIERVSKRATFFLLLAVVGLSACSGGSVNLAPQPQKAFAHNIPGTVTQNAKIVLPPGSQVAMGDLTVKNSLTLTKPASTGAFTVTQFAGDEQFAFVTNAQDDAVLAGFVGPRATTIDATSTAKVFVYWSAGFFTLPMPYREQAIDAVASEPGFSNVSDAFASDLTNSSNPFLHAMGRANIVSAVQQFTKSIYASRGLSASKLGRVIGAANTGRRRSDVVVAPTTAASGITTVADAAGVHFTNTYRRLAQAFIDEDSYVDATGKRVTKSVIDALAPVRIPAVSGSNGVSGGPIDVALALLGGSVAYAPVSTNTYALIAEPGAKSTRYRITIVGAGKTNAAVTLSAEQTAAQKSIVLQQLAESYLVPLVASIAIPIDSTAIDGYFAAGGSSDLATLVAAADHDAPQIYPVADSGQVGDALVLGMNALAGDQPLQSQLLGLVGNFISATAGATAAQAYNTGYSPLYALDVLSAMVISSDTSVASANIAASSEADTFVVDVSGVGPTPSPMPSSSASAPPTTPPSASPAPTSSASLTGNIYAAENGNSSVTVTAVGATGNVAPVRTIIGANTGISNAYGLTVDAGGAVYVSGLSSGQISVFAPGASGNVSPVRQLNGLSAPLGLAIDSAGNLIEANFGSNSVNVFGPTANGSAAPLRTIAGSNTGLSSPYGITLDAAGRLYVVNDASQFGGTDSVTVFAAGANGNAAPIETIMGNQTGMSGATYVAVDASNDIFVSNAYANTVTEYAAGANGNVAPIATIAGSNTGISTPGGIAFGPDGTLYISNYRPNGILAFAKGNYGNVAPIRSTYGSSTGINTAQQMVVAP